MIWGKTHYFRKHPNGWSSRIGLIFPLWIWWGLYRPHGPVPSIHLGALHGWRVWVNGKSVVGKTQPSVATKGGWWWWILEGFFWWGGGRFEENCGFKTLSIYLLLFFSCFKPCSALFVLICLLWWVKIISIDFWNVFPCGASRFFWLLHFERRLW